MGTLSIPQSAAPFFQEYDFQHLDPVADRILILERILAYGNRAELRWLFERYERPEICAWIKENGHKRLPLKRYNLWCVLLDIERILPKTPRIWKY